MRKSMDHVARSLGVPVPHANTSYRIFEAYFAGYYIMEDDYEHAINIVSLKSSYHRIKTLKHIDNLTYNETHLAMYHESRRLFSMGVLIDGSQRYEMLPPDNIFEARCNMILSDYIGYVPISIAQLVKKLSKKYSLKPYSEFKSEPSVPEMVRDAVHDIRLICDERTPVQYI